MSSQKEIAALLNLSQATVSRALRDDKGLPLKTIMLVKQAAKKAGHISRRYESRKAAEAPKSPPRPAETPGRSGGSDIKSAVRILALVSGYTMQSGVGEGTIAFEIIQGLIRATKTSNIDLIVKSIDSLGRAKAMVARYENRVAGCIAMLRFPDEVIGYLSAHFPCISINHHYEDLNVKVIEPDQEKAFSRLYRHFHGRGHRRIGFLTIADSHLFIFRRYSGYLLGCRQSGEMAHPEWTVNVDASPQLDFDAMVEKIIALHRGDGVSGFICTSGSLARNLIDALAGRGLRVPEDISFAAFDEVVLPLENGQLLCGAQADYEKMARIATEVLPLFARFRTVDTISCDAEFQYGDTVAEKK